MVAAVGAAVAVGTAVGTAVAVGMAVGTAVAVGTVAVPSACGAVLISSAALLSAC